MHSSPTAIDFKYAQNHSALACECPDQNHCKPIAIMAYRFVDLDLANKDIYRPPLIINSSLIGTKCKNNCNGYALSFFTTMEFATAKLLKILENTPMFHLNSIASCDITEADGVCSDPNNAGHFELHEFETAEFTNRFNVVKTL